MIKKTAGESQTPIIFFAGKAIGMRIMKKILAIEDETVIRENICDLLSLEDYHAMAAENGKIGVARAIEHLPDLILRDMMMPELDGYGFLHQLKQNSATKTIPFIFLTAKATKMDFR